MIAVSDTGPLNYLILIGQVEVLPALYTRLLIPVEVKRELMSEGAPFAVRQWVAELREVG